MKKLFIFSMLVTFFVVLITTASCRHDELPQLPAPMSGVEFYEFILGEHSSNPTRLQDRVQNGQIFSVILLSTAIEVSRILEHIRERALEPDWYVECEFESTQWVLRLNIGETVGVYGHLAEAFDSRIGPDSKAVKLRDCTFLPSPDPSGS